MIKNWTIAFISIKALNPTQSILRFQFELGCTILLRHPRSSSRQNKGCEIFRIHRNPFRTQFLRKWHPFVRRFLLGPSIFCVRLHFCVKQIFLLRIVFLKAFWVADWWLQGSEEWRRQLNLKRIKFGWNDDKSV
jgi:hypothetical protein